MKISKKILVILGIFVILIICLFFVLKKKNTNVDNSTYQIVNNDYSIEKAMSKNTLSNLLKDTNYLSFMIHPVVIDAVKKTKFFAHDDYLILSPIDEDFVIVTDKSNFYKIVSGKVVNHKKLNNYDVNSFIMDIRVQDVQLEASMRNGIITDRFISNNQHSGEKTNYLNENFGDIFNFTDEYDALNVAYFFEENTLELKGYNMTGLNPDGSEVLYVMNNIIKELDEEDKNNISNWINIVKNYKE